MRRVGKGEPHLAAGLALDAALGHEAADPEPLARADLPLCHLRGRDEEGHLVLKSGQHEAGRPAHEEQGECQDHQPLFLAQAHR
jgi:hypothetical protein